MANHPENNGHSGHGSTGGSHHHILPNKVLFGIGGALLVLTVLTVAVAHVDLGRLNFVVAIAIAAFKATLVALFFMNLWYDRKENGVIFATSFLFLAIFIVLTSMDIFFRGDVYVKGPLMAAQAKSKLKNPWISTPQLVAHGKELFAVNCTSCHGIEGKGDGPAASALVPHPRNFTSTEGWKNGRKATMIFKTLKEGLPPSAMASFATLPADDRWALAQYVLSLNPTPPAKDTPEDFKKAGVDMNGGGEAEEKVIPVQLAMERMAVDEAHAATNGMAMSSDAVQSTGLPASGAARIYATSCAQCHGAHGQGGIKVKNLGVYPSAYITTKPFSGSSAGLASAEAFNRIVIQGIPGDVMPGNGQLSGGELHDLYQYVRSLR
jgi:caa(3)-type oxidase subunit IV